MSVVAIKILIGVPNIIDLATHMAKYQPILTELLVKKVLKKVLKILSGNAGGSGENCESQSELNYIRGGGRETQDGNLFFSLLNTPAFMKSWILC